MTDAYFTGFTAQEKNIKNEVKTNEFDFMAPLLMDVATMDMYLLDNVSMRIRLEFATDECVVNAKSATLAQNPLVKIDNCKLHLTTLKPRDSAREALGMSLQRNPLSYV